MRFIRDPFLTGRPDLTPWRHVFHASLPTIDWEALEQVSDWCEDQFGPEGKRWSATGWRVNFRDSVDATAFMVRWV
ncbi:MAG: hypothetical protein EOO77_39145 [Oxalobacteraceae bacterium]|nr:MAG: hypothetical protein EOO77_39145 [Oxalobacteraceae bacterium]